MLNTVQSLNSFSYKQMNTISSNKIRLISGCSIAVLLFLCSSCVYDKEYMKYTNDQIAALQKTTSELKESNAAKIDAVNASQADIMLEIEALKKEITDLSGRVEDNEHLLKHNYEKELGENEDAKSQVGKLKEKIESLEKMVNYHHYYLNLEPFEYIKPGSNEVALGGTPAIGSAPGSTEQKPNDVALYESNLDLFNAQNYEQALTGFKSFLDTYPKSTLADNAQFWIGECLMGLKQYQTAILAFQDVIKKYPDGNKVPNAMLKQAVAMKAINDLTSTKIILKNLIKTYPKSPEAAIAQKKLDAMD